MTYILEDVLSDQLISTWSLLDLRLQQIARLRSLQLLPLLVKRRWRLQRYAKKNIYHIALYSLIRTINFKHDIALKRRGESYLD